MSGLRLWGVTTARTLRPLWVLEELGLDYTLEPIGPRTGETQTDAYRSLNPKQKVPLFNDGELWLSESMAICRYLVEAYGPGPFALPRDAAERARLDDWMSWIYGELDETSLYVMRRHRDLSAVYGDAPAAVASSQAYAERHLSVMAERLGSQSTILEAGFSVADVLLVTCLDWAHAYGLAVPASLTAYRHEHAARKAYERARQVNFPES